MRDDERVLLEPALEAFTRWFHAEVRMARLAPPVPGAPEDLYTFTLPETFAPSIPVGMSGYFDGASALVKYAQRFGLRWGPDRRILTMPTPSTFNALREVLGPRRAGYRVALSIEDGPEMSAGSRLIGYLDGTLLVRVCTPAYYRKASRRFHGRQRARVAVALMTLANDMSARAFAYHAIPEASMSRLRVHIEGAFPELIARWHAPGARAPITMTTFFDNDLKLFCHGIWALVRRVEDFGPRFEANFDRIVEVLELRIAETRQGLGELRDIGTLASVTIDTQ